MKLQKFKERNKNQKYIIIFTIACVLLITGVFLYKTFAIFQTNLNEDMIEGEVQDIGDLEFAFYIDDGKGDQISKTAPKKDDGYSLDTSSSYCKDMTTGKQIGSINWNQERWSAEVKDITTTKTKCYLHFKKIYEEDTLNGATPDLMNGRLVPVVISEKEKPSDITEYTNNTQSYGGKVEKADITNTSNPWYSYKDKKWANAVILRDGVVDNYVPGEEIKEKDIESYFVWIPRYQYVLQEDVSTFDSYSGVTELGNKTNVTEVYDAMKNANQEGNKEGNKATNHPFEIEFGSKENGNKQGSKKGDSITHPAFEAFDSNGFWVGKFETGYNQNSDPSLEITTENWNSATAINENLSPEKVIIKPSVYGWRGFNISHFFYTSYDYKRELESHMMKNTEWGAVAYLTYSKYGRCDSSNKSCSEVRNNNVSPSITGSSSNFEPTCGYTAGSETCHKNETINKLYMDGDYSYNYYNVESRISSTTGNYSGIYDMSGGIWEVVMGVMQGKNDNSKAPASGKDKSFNSGFKGPYSNCNENGAINGEECGQDTENKDGFDWPSSKYYDLYDYSTTGTDYKNGILGDATKEVGPFYRVSYNNGNTVRYIGSYNADLSYFIEDIGPWFFRGDGVSDGTDAGLFAFTSLNGLSSVSFGFRIILTP